MPSHIFHHRLERCFGYHFDTNILFCSNKQAICCLFSSQSNTWISIAIYRDLFVFCNEVSGNCSYCCNWTIVDDHYINCIFTNNVLHILSSCLKSMRFLSGVFFYCFSKQNVYYFPPVEDIM